MRMIILFLSLNFVNFATTVKACDMPEGFHEFETFGENSIYLHHYPMFGSVHSYQILVKAELMRNGKNITQAFLSLRKAKGGVSFSTSPIRTTGDEAYAVLADYAKVGAQFQARVHYESKGKNVDLFKNVTVVVKEVILNRLMNQPKVGSSKPSALQYFYFGDQTEGYLIHKMYWNPDFDQVVQIAPLPNSLKCAGSLTVIDRPNSEKGRMLGAQNAFAISSCNENILIQPLKEVYEAKMSIQH